MVLEGGVYHIMETIKQEACGLVLCDMNLPMAAYEKQVVFGFMFHLRRLETCLA
jgi:hypothetical protein